MRWCNRLREARESAGLTQAALSEQATVSRATIILLERDTEYEPTAAVQRRLSTALGRTDLFWIEPAHE